MTNSVVQTLLELWGAWCSDYLLGEIVPVTVHPLSEDFSQCPIWASPDAASFYFLVSCHWSAETYQQLPFRCPPWGSCRLRWGHLLAFFSLSCTNQVTTDLHRSIFRRVLLNPFISNPDIQAHTHKTQKKKQDICLQRKSLGFLAGQSHRAG